MRKYILGICLSFFLFGCSSLFTALGNRDIENSVRIYTVRGLTTDGTRELIDGLSYAPQTVAFIVGGYGCRTLLSHFESKKLLPWILALFFASVLIMFIISLSMTVTTIWPILIPFCFLAVANGAVYPLVISAALSDFRNCSATAAGLLNFMQTMVCFAASGLVSAFAGYGLLTVTIAMFITGFIAIIGFILVTQARHQQPVMATA